MQRGWYENLCLYVLLAMESSEGKSPIVRVLSQQLIAYEREQIAHRRVAKQRYDDAGPDKNIPDPGPKPRIVARNFTPEELASLMRERLSEKGWSWGYGPRAGVPASAGSGHTPAEAGTPGARSGVAGHPACRGTDANHLFRQSLRTTNAWLF